MLARGAEAAHSLGLIEARRRGDGEFRNTREVRMTVARILALKGRDVVTTQPHRTLAEVARLMADKGIGAVIVTSADGDVLGILSERDVVRAAARGGGAALEEAASKHMTTQVVTATESTAIVAVMEHMTAGRFRHVPIVEGGKLRGLVSIGDVVKHRLAEIESEHQALREYIATA
jgi:CBS domain-containing protein